MQYLPTALLAPLPLHVAVVSSALARLRRGPEEAGALRWDQLRAQW